MNKIKLQSTHNAIIVSVCLKKGYLLGYIQQVLFIMLCLLLMPLALFAGVLAFIIYILSATFLGLVIGTFEILMEIFSLEGGFWKNQKN